MLGVIGNKFSIGRETYHPFSAELHYFRIDKRHWSISFERIKRAGFGLISTAVPWNVHQDENKFLDFAGMSDPRKDLIVFLELAREFGFKVILRPGPWVSSQLENGGLPNFLFRDTKLLARDASGQELKLKDDYGIKGGYLPSYLHPNYLYHLKNYFKAFIEVTKNYVHPRGPVFMIELDYETSFGGLVNPDSADYNQDVLTQYYPPYLESLYGEIKKLNNRYKEKKSGFSQVEPPRKFKSLQLKDYPKVFDWFRFRQYMLNKYLETIEDIFKSYTVEPLIFRSLYFRSGDLLPAYDLVPDDRSPFLGSNVFSNGTYFDLLNKARFLRSEYGFAYATSFVTGNAAVDTERESTASPITENLTRFYLASGISSGFKGMNFHMFVDRDHWYGAPLHNDGTVSETYEVLKRFNHGITTSGLEEMEDSSQVAVVGNRLYHWLRLTSSAKEFKYINRLLDNSTIGFCRDLMRLKLHYGIRENRDWESLGKYKLLFIASAEIMSSRDQEAIVKLAKSGVCIVMCGIMPRYDEQFKECQILANHFRVKTTVDYHIGSVSHKGGSFPCYIYGSIRTTDDAKVKKLVREGTKLVGICSTRFKGNFYFFSCDLASEGNHKILSFIESLLQNENVSSHLYCSDPSIDISFQMGIKKGLLAVVAPPPGDLSDGLESDQKEVIIQADLKPAGMNAAILKLTNLFAGEDDKPLKVTAKDLKMGIPLTIKFPDGYVFVVEKGR